MEKISFSKLANFFEKQKLALEATKNFEFVLYGGSVGSGKILADDGVILTPFGWKKGKDLKVGCLVNNPDGSVQKIIQIKPRVRLTRWRVYFSDGTFTDVAEDHLWLAWKGGKSRKIKNKKVFGFNSAEIVETRKLKEWLEKGYKPQIPVCKEQSFNRATKEQERISPYLLGLLLGDGSITKRGKISISCTTKDCKHYLKRISGSWGFTNGVIYPTGETKKSIEKKLQFYGLLGKYSYNKFIPEIYKLSSIKDRYELIRGLMDTDGYSPKKTHNCYFYTTSKKLAEDVAFVLRSLGAVVTITKKRGSYKKNEKKINCREIYNLYIKHRNKDLLFSLPRKKHGLKEKEISKSVVKIEVNGKITGRCIAVSNPNGLYITNDFIVTHNSRWLRWTALYWLLKWAAQGHEGVQVGLFCESYPTLYDRQIKSIKKEFPEWLGTFYEQKHEFILNKEYGGGIIALRNLDDPAKYLSSEFALIGIDEITRTPKETFDALKHRKRWVGISNTKFIAACNPIGEHMLWVREFFVEKTLSDADCKKAIYIPAKPTDNPHLPKEYFESLKNMPEKERKALLEGDWYAFEGYQDSEGYLPLITSTELEEALLEEKVGIGNPFIIGVDVGAGGDKTAIVVRDNLIAKVLFNQKLSDTMQLAPILANIIAEYNPSLHNSSLIAIDITGVGKGIYDRLNETGFRTITKGVVFGAKSTENDRFFNLKAELYWKAKEWLKKGGKLAKNEDWKEALTIKYKILSDRLIQMQPKKELLKSGIQSPNVWDAFALTFSVDIHKLREFKEFDLEEF